MAVVAVFGLGCAGSRPGEGADDAVVATVDGERITAAELDAALAQPLAELDGQMYTLRRQKLDEVIGDRLIAAEARRQGMSADELVALEVNAKVQVTDAEIEPFVEANRSRWTGPEAELRRRIREELERQRRAAARRAFVEALAAKAAVDISLPLPTAFRLDVPVEGAAAVRGPADAPVTIIEFTDFHCPYCKSVQPTLAEIEKRYGRHVRLVQHDLPIDQIHPDARVVHEAVRCAGEQGKFWEYRDRAFALAPASPDRLPGIAREIGLDLAAFDACRKGPAVRDAVRRSSELASRLGLGSTPTFFINGRQVVGAQPLDRFVLYIEAELKSAGVATN